MQRPRGRGLSTINPFIEPVMRCRCVKASLVSFDDFTSNEGKHKKEYNAYLLYDTVAGAMDGGPKYALFRGAEKEAGLPPLVVADVNGKRLFITLRLEVQASNDLAMIVPIESSYVMHNVMEKSKAKNGIAMIAVSLANGRWKGTLGELVGEKANARKVNIQPRRRMYNIMIIEGDSHYLFVKGNNLENLTDIAPEFLAMDISKKYVMNIDDGEYYGARVVERGVKALLRKIDGMASF